MGVKEYNRILNKIFGIFYSPLKVLSYGRFLNMSVGLRSIGKSTGWAIFFLLEFLFFGRQFIYSRRTEKELNKSKKDYFSDAISIISEYTDGIKSFKIEGNEYFMNGERCGFAVPLGTQQQNRGSMQGSNIWWILYDEFMIMPGTNSSYLGGKGNISAEVDALLGLRETVDRKKGMSYRNEVRIILCGNAATYFNPFFIYYGVDRYLRPDTKYLAPKGELWMLEQTFETEATKEIEESVAYKLARGAHREYAFKNKYADLHNANFIEKVKGDKDPLFNFSYEGGIYGIWGYNDGGYIYVSNEECKGCDTYSLTTADHRPNYYMLSRYSDSYDTVMLKRMYDFGAVRFKTAKCKMVVDFFLRYDII